MARLSLPSLTLACFLVSSCTLFLDTGVPPVPEDPGGGEGSGEPSDDCGDCDWSRTRLPVISDVFEDFRREPPPDCLEGIDDCDGGGPPSGYLVQFASFGWPAGIVRSSEYHVHLAPTASVMQRAESDTYRIIAFPFDLTW